MATADDMLAVLRSIDASLKTLVTCSAGRATGGGDVADDRDLDSQWGDPVIKAKDPRDWPGPSMVGRRFSECPPDYLDLLAARFDYFAKKAEETGETYNNKPIALYKRKDAARARGWAQRMRTGRCAVPQVDAPTVVAFPPPQGQTFAGFGDAPFTSDDIPF